MWNKHLGLYIVILFVLGVIFRLLLTLFFPQPFVFDQGEYDRFAKGILNIPFYVETARLYGYPLLVSLVYKIAGVDNRNLLFFMQAALDALSAVLVFLIARRLFSQVIPSIFSYILFLFNPYTSAYVGVMLPEVFSVFLVTISFFLFFQLLRKNNMLYSVLVAGVLGYLVVVRPTFLYFSIIFLLYILIYSIRTLKKHSLKFLVIMGSLLFYFLSFVYNLVGNVQHFQQYSFLTVDNLMVSQLYISEYIEKAPLHVDSSQNLPIEVQNLFREYSTVPINQEQRYQMAEKYMQLSLNNIKQQPTYFFITRLKKLWYGWEKKAVFFYEDPDIPFLSLISNTLNILLIGFFVFGIYLYFKSVWKTHLNVWKRHFVIACIFFILYVTVVHSLSGTEERYSIPAYPLIFLFGGFGLYSLLVRIYKRKKFLQASNG